MEHTYSDHYYEMMELHAKAHREGISFADTHRPAESTFGGCEVKKYAHVIKYMHDLKPFRYVLDWGCGKAQAYSKAFRLKDGTIVKNLPTYMGIPRAGFTLYDPCIEEYSIKPSADCKYDLVICTDVLEHIPEEDIDAVLTDIFSRCNGVVFASVACYEAQSELSGGVNAHCNIQEPSYWRDKFNEFSDRYNAHCVVNIISKDVENNCYPVSIFYKLPKNMLDKVCKVRQ